MYNLFVTANCDAWNGAPEKFELARCLREYTDPELVKRFAQLSQEDITELQQYPCIFAHERSCGTMARLGHLKRITRRDAWVRVEYLMDANYPPVSADTLTSLMWDLEIKNWEMNRTHWALKDVDLYAVLANADGAALMDTVPNAPADVTSAMFDVALSFPGETRDYACLVAERLSLLLGRHRVFFDGFYQAQLARPNLDTLLQDIYGRRSRLVVVFLCKAYASKDWCGIEFRAIREIINRREDDRVMYVRHDDGHVDGVLSTDGYIDANEHTPIEVADMIYERLRIGEEDKDSGTPLTGAVRQRSTDIRDVEQRYADIEDSGRDNGIGAFLAAGVANLTSDEDIREVVVCLERRGHHPIQPGVRAQVMQHGDLRHFFERAADRWSSESLRNIQVFVDEVLDQYTSATLLRINERQHVGLPAMTESTTEPIDFAILTAIEVERRAVCEAFGLTEEHRVRKDSRVYWRGKLPLSNGDAYELVVAQAPDAANIDAALLTNDLLHHWKPGAALLVGIAASADPGEVQLGDVVLGSEVYYHERGKVTPQGTRPEPKLISADATLWSNVMAVPDWDANVQVLRPDGTDAQPTVHTGVIASGEKVIADVGTRDEILTGHRKIVAIEMEGYGFSRAVWQSFEHVRHLDIRAICDYASDDKNDGWHAYAAAAAAGFAKHFLRDRPLEPRTGAAASGR